MKHIESAWIEQILIFENEQEVEQFIEELEQKKQRRNQKYNVVEKVGIRIRVQKQYNNNTFPMKEGD
ncbi:MAG: hypothetical protein ACERKZ_02300 [Lachnotalea sp.]